MKKTLLFLLLALITIFFMKTIYAKERKTEYIEKYNTIEFENLNSKNVNEIFKDLTGNIIEIEVQTKAFTKTYKFNTRMTENIEKELINKLTKDLTEINQKELATSHQISGVKITKIKILCSNEELKIIKERIKND